jgi:hypothetical protein
MPACSTPDCDGEVGENSKHDECANCRSYHRRWSKRSPGDARERHQQLQLWDTRIQSHLKNNHKNAGAKNVITLTPPPMRKRA